MRTVHFFAIFLLAGMSGCMFEEGGEQTAGAEDFPNTLGSAMIGNVSEHTGWDQFSEVPTVLPGFESAGSLADSLATLLLKTVGLGKATAIATAAATADTTIWEYFDTLKLARRVRVQNLIAPLAILTDTSIFRYDAASPLAFIARIALGDVIVLEEKGALSWSDGRLETYGYWNLDTSRGINFSTYDKTTLIDVQPLPGGSQLKQCISTLSGPDGNLLASDDNVPAYFALSRTLGLDTLEAFEIKDADGDGALWAAGDSGLVDYYRKVKNPILRPSVASFTQRLRTVLFKNGQKSYPCAFGEERTEKDGKRVAFSVRGLRPDSSFLGGETVLVKLHAVFPEGSALSEKHCEYRVTLPSAKNYAGNRLLSFALDVRRSQGEIGRMQFRFTPDASVPSRELSIVGGLESEVDFSDGRTGTLTSARFENGQLDVLLAMKKSDGAVKRFHVRWDMLGKLLLKEPRDTP